MYCMCMCICMFLEIVDLIPVTYICMYIHRQVLSDILRTYAIVHRIRKYLRKYFQNILVRGGMACKRSVPNETAEVPTRRHKPAAYGYCICICI